MFSKYLIASSLLAGQGVVGQEAVNCFISVTPRQSLSLDMENGDELTTFSSVEVECGTWQNNTEGVQELKPYNLYMRKCNTEWGGNIFYSSALQDCGWCPYGGEDYKYLVEDAEPKMKEDYADFHGCYPDVNSGKCTCNGNHYIWREDMWGSWMEYRHLSWEMTPVDPGLVFTWQAEIWDEATRTSRYGYYDDLKYRYELFSNFFEIQNSEMMPPQLECDSDVAMGSVPGISNIYIPPTVKKDPIKTFLRLINRYGFESKLNVMETSEMTGNYLTILLLHEVQRKGTTVKVGPSLDEFREHCKIKFNIFVDPYGTEMQGSRFVDGSQFIPTAPRCSQEGMDAEVVEYNQVLTRLASTLNADVSCNNTFSSWEWDDADRNPAPCMKIPVDSDECLGYTDSTGCCPFEWRWVHEQMWRRKLLTNEEMAAQEKSRATNRVDEERAPKKIRELMTFDMGEMAEHALQTEIQEVKDGFKAMNENKENFFAGSALSKQMRHELELQAITNIRRHQELQHITDPERLRRKLKAMHARRRVNYVQSSALGKSMSKSRRLSFYNDAKSKSLAKEELRTAENDVARDGRLRQLAKTKKASHEEIREKTTSAAHKAAILGRIMEVEKLQQMAYEYEQSKDPKYRRRLLKYKNFRNLLQKRRTSYLDSIFTSKSEAFSGPVTVRLSNKEDGSFIGSRKTSPQVTRKQLKPALSPRKLGKTSLFSPTNSLDKIVKRASVAYEAKKTMDKAKKVVEESRTNSRTSSSDKNRLLEEYGSTDSDEEEEEEEYGSGTSSGGSGGPPENTDDVTDTYWGAQCDYWWKFALGWGGNRWSDEMWSNAWNHNWDRQHTIRKCWQDEIFWDGTTAHETAALCTAAGGAGCWKRPRVMVAHTLGVDKITLRDGSEMLVEDCLSSVCSMKVDQDRAFFHDHDSEQIDACNCHVCNNGYTTDPIASFIEDVCKPLLYAGFWDFQHDCQECFQNPVALAKEENTCLQQSDKADGTLDENIWDTTEDPRNGMSHGMWRRFLDADGDLQTIFGCAEHKAWDEEDPDGERLEVYDIRSDWDQDQHFSSGYTVGECASEICLLWTHYMAALNDDNDYYDNAEECGCVYCSEDWMGKAQHWFFESNCDAHNVTSAFGLEYASSDGMDCERRWDEPDSAGGINTCEMELPEDYVSAHEKHWLEWHEWYFERWDANGTEIELGTEHIEEALTQTWRPIEKCWMAEYVTENENVRPSDWGLTWSTNMITNLVSASDAEYLFSDKCLAQSAMCRIQFGRDEFYMEMPPVLCPNQEATDISNRCKNMVCMLFDQKAKWMANDLRTHEVYTESNLADMCLPCFTCNPEHQYLISRYMKETCKPNNLYHSSYLGPDNGGAMCEEVAASGSWLSEKCFMADRGTVLKDEPGGGWHHICHEQMHKVQNYDPVLSQCMDVLTKRWDGRFTGACFSPQVIDYSAVDKDLCSKKICRDVLKFTMFAPHNKCDVNALCCGVGDTESLFAFCDDPELEALYAERCPYGCRQPKQEYTQWGWPIHNEAKCHTCHDQCWGCNERFDESICHMRCDQDACGQGREEDRWALWEGMSCNRKREVMTRMSENALRRAFLFTGSDTVTGCNYFLDMWVTYGKVLELSPGTTRCMAPEWTPEGGMSDEWLNDPCCNWDKRREMCCAPRQIQRWRNKITGIDTEKLGMYVAIMTQNQPGISVEDRERPLRIAEGYKKNEGKAQTDCFPAFFTQYNATQNVWAILDECEEAVMGIWDSTYNKMVGGDCDVDSECDTGSCKAPQAAAGGASTGTSSASSGETQNKCVLPIDTESGNYAIPFAKCLIRKTKANLPAMEEYLKTKYFGTVAGISSDDVAAAIMAESGMTREACQGSGLDGDYWEKWHWDEEHCGVQTVCNWEHGLSGVGCTDPCGLSETDPVCPNYCAMPGQRWEMSEYPTCRIEGETHMIHNDMERCWPDVAEPYQNKLNELYQECFNVCHEMEQAYYDAEAAFYEEEEAALANGEEWDKEWDWEEEWPDVEGCHTDCQVNYEPSWDKIRPVYEQCLLEACQNFNPDLTLFRHDCVFASMSFLDEHRSACAGGCMEEGGPQPAQPKRCFGKITAEAASDLGEEACWEMGEGHIEPRTDWDKYDRWDWSLGHPPPEHCWIRSYWAVDGKPWIPPPPYGVTCEPGCEEEARRCLHMEACWKWDDVLEEHKWQTCNGIFDKYRDEFKMCEQDMDAQGIPWEQKKSMCRQSVEVDGMKLTDDPEFESLGCMVCDMHEQWMNWDEKRVHCFRQLKNDNCRWKTESDLVDLGISTDVPYSQPCAEECHHHLCWQTFERCHELGDDTKLNCQNTTLSLNQCRNCEDFIRCEDMCENSCNSEHFHWWGHSVDACEGCGTDMACNPSAECFGSRECFGETPPYGMECSRACEKKIDHCRHTSQNVCWDWNNKVAFVKNATDVYDDWLEALRDGDTASTGEDQHFWNPEHWCSEGYYWKHLSYDVDRCSDDLMWVRFHELDDPCGDYTRDCYEEKRHAAHIECVSTVLDTKDASKEKDYFVHTCQSNCNGPWNNWRIWGTVQGPKCIEDHGCEADCVPESCSDMTPNCWNQFEKNCTWVDEWGYRTRNDLEDWSTWQDAKEEGKYFINDIVCANTQVDIFNNVKAEFPVCYGCTQARCHDFCRHPCSEFRENFHHDWVTMREMNRHCQACSSDFQIRRWQPNEDGWWELKLSPAQCYPGADCWLDITGDWDNLPTSSDVESLENCNLWQKRYRQLKTDDEIAKQSADFRREVWDTLSGKDDHERFLERWRHLEENPDRHLDHEMNDMLSQMGHLDHVESRHEPHVKSNNEWLRKLNERRTELVKELGDHDRILKSGGPQSSASNEDIRTQIKMEIKGYENAIMHTSNRAYEAKKTVTRARKLRKLLVEGRERKVRSLSRTESKKLKETHSMYKYENLKRHNPDMLQSPLMRKHAFGGSVRSLLEQGDKKRRELKRVYPEEVRLNCLGNDCATEESLCTNFFERGGVEQDRVDAVIESFSFGSAPWDSEEQACAELGQICYVSLEDAKAAVMEFEILQDWCYRELHNAVVQDYEYCDGFGDNCDGCVDGCKDWDCGCDHCCMCNHNNQTIAMAAADNWNGAGWECHAMGWGGISTAARLAFNQPMDWHIWDSWWQIHESIPVHGGQFDDRLFNGNGGCRHWIDTWKLKDPQCWDWWFAKENAEYCTIEITNDMCLRPFNATAIFASEHWDTDFYTREENKQAQRDLLMGKPLNESGTPAQDPKIMDVYVRERRWQKGRLSTEETCEAEQCYPEIWRSEADCPNVRHCEGEHCQYCQPWDFWQNPKEAKKKAVCVLKDGGSGELVTDSATCTAGGGKMYESSKDNIALCVVNAPDDVDGETDFEKCSQGATFDFTANSTSGGSTTITGKYHPWTCADFNKFQCDWAGENFAVDILGCHNIHMMCQNKDDCLSSGRCQYDFHDWNQWWIMEEDGGFCLRPTPLKEDYTDMWVDGSNWGMCPNENIPGYVAHPMGNFGCVFFVDGNYVEEAPTTSTATSTPGTTRRRTQWWMGDDSKMQTTGMTSSLCNGIGGKWFPTAQDKADCVPAGAAFDPNPNHGNTSDPASDPTKSIYAPGSFACCVEGRHNGWHFECWQWSADSQVECAACGATWTSIFRWENWSKWIIGKWQKTYTWNERKQSPRNKWITKHSRMGLESMWENTAAELRVEPMRSFIKCRGEPRLQSLKGLAYDEVIQPGLCDLTLNQGSTRDNVCTTEVQLTPDSNSVAAATATNMTVLSSSVLAGSNRPNGTTSIVSRRKLRRPKTAKKDIWRRFLQTTGSTNGVDISSLPASCFTIVKSSSDKFVGQLVGDCISFNPEQDLSAAAELTVGLNEELLVNGAFDVFDIGILTADYVEPLGSNQVTVTSTGESMTAYVKNQGTYCPIKRMSTYIGSEVVSADHTCPEYDALAALIEESRVYWAAQDISMDDLFLQKDQGNGLVAETSLITTTTPQTVGGVYFGGGDSDEEEEEATDPEAQYVEIPVVSASVQIAFSMPSTSTPTSLLEDTSFTGMLTNGLAAALNKTQDSITIVDIRFPFDRLRRRLQSTNQLIIVDYQVECESVEESNALVAQVDPDSDGGASVFEAALQSAIEDEIEADDTLSAAYTVQDVSSLSAVAEILTVIVTTTEEPIVYEEYEYAPPIEINATDANTTMNVTANVTKEESTTTSEPLVSTTEVPTTTEEVEAEVEDEDASTEAPGSSDAFRTSSAVVVPLLLVGAMMK